MTAKAAVIERIKSVGVIPVVRAASAEEALRVVDAIRAGGLSIVEITMTVPGALRAIERVTRNFGTEVLVGAGTVLDSSVAHDCVDAGARFIVTPALLADTIIYCSMHEVAVLPGALTPTEIVQAASAGADLVKVFPVGAMGGANYVQSLKAPLPHIELVPTGGVTLANAASFIAAGASAIGVGGDLVNLEALRRGQPDVITTAARAYLEAVRAARNPEERAATFRYKTR